MSDAAEANASDAGDAGDAGVTRSVDIDAILAKRRAYVLHIEEAAAALQKAALYGDGELEVRSGRGRYSCHHFPRAEAVAYLVERFDAGQWWFLLKESGLYTFLDAEARATWHKHLDEGTFPELNVDNVHATFSILYEQRADMFERGVIKLWRSLSWDFRTNSPHRLGRRIILTGAVERFGGGVSHRFCDVVDDLVRVMTVLDRKPEPDHRSGAWAQLARHEVGWPTRTNDVVINGLFSLRGFKKGTCHLTFLRLDLVDELNRIIAKHHPDALPPAS